MDGDADIQGILIRRQRDLGGLDTLVRGIATTQNDLLLSLAVVPIADLAPKLEALINHTGRNLRTRHRIRLLTIQWGSSQVLDHRSRNVLRGTPCDHQLHHKPQQHQHQEVQSIGSPRCAWCCHRKRSRRKSRKRLHLYDRGKNEPKHVRRERVDVLQ